MLRSVPWSTSVSFARAEIVVVSFSKTVAVSSFASGSSLTDTTFNEIVAVLLLNKPSFA